MASIRVLDTNVTSPDMYEFTFHLKNDKFFLPDIMNDTKRIMDTAGAVFARSCQPFALVDGKNKIGGVFFMADLVPGHEAGFYVWVWGKVITATTLPFIREYIDANADEYGLYRVVARTPCQKCVNLLEHLGFVLEGRFKGGFKYKGKVHTLYQLRRLFGRR